MPNPRSETLGRMSDGLDRRTFGGAPRPMPSPVALRGAKLRRWIGWGIMALGVLLIVAILQLWSVLNAMGPLAAPSGSLTLIVTHAILAGIAVIAGTSSEASAHHTPVFIALLGTSLSVSVGFLGLGLAAAIITAISALIVSEMTRYALILRGEL